MAIINSFPSRIELGGVRIDKGFLVPIIFVLFFVGVLLSNIAPDIVLPVMAALIAVVALLVWRIYSRAGRRDVMEFGHDGVFVREAGLLRDRTWKASYDEFEGVRLRERRARAGRSRQATYQIIELVHPDRGRILPLYVRMENDPPLALLEHYSRLFSLPAIS
jgi:hypothetical protein